MKNAKKKRVKNGKEEPKQHFSNEKPGSQKAKQVDEVSPFGGMNLANFKKNLGCGS